MSFKKRAGTHSNSHRHSTKPYSSVEDQIILEEPDNQVLSGVLGRTVTAIAKRKSRLKLMNKPKTPVLIKSQLQLTFPPPIIAVAIPKTKKYSDFLRSKVESTLNKYGKINKTSRYTLEEDAIILTTPSNIAAGIILKRHWDSVASRRGALKKMGKTPVEAAPYGLKSVIKTMLKDGFDFGSWLSKNEVKPVILQQPTGDNWSDDGTNLADKVNREVQVEEPKVVMLESMTKDMKEKLYKNTPPVPDLSVGGMVVAIGYTVIYNGKEITLPAGKVPRIEGKIFIEY